MFDEEYRQGVQRALRDAGLVKESSAFLGALGGTALGAGGAALTGSRDPWEIAAYGAAGALSGGLTGSGIKRLLRESALAKMTAERLAAEKEFDQILSELA